MAYAMTKRGSQDNVVTYEFMCDTISDLEAIENKYKTIGTIAIVLQGENGMEVYIAGSDKQWNSLSAIGGGSSDNTASLSIYVCPQNEISNGLPDVELPDENTIYLVAAGNTTGNLYEEYIYVDDTWEKFGAASIDLSNYIQKTDIATQSTAGLVKVLDNGNVTFNENNQLVLTLAGTAVVKTGQSDHPISVTHQHEAAFYGLAKAAGQDMKNSNNAVGTYTNEAKNAIRTMIGAGTYTKPNNGIPASDLAETYLTSHQDISDKADKFDTILENSLSLGRRINSEVGSSSIALGGEVAATAVGSIALGINNLASGYSAIAIGNSNQASGLTSTASGYGSTAQGDYSSTENYGTIAIGVASHAEGNATATSGLGSHAEGMKTEASGRQQHTEGKYNIVDIPYSNWSANTNYTENTKVIETNYVYKCLIAHTSSSSFVEDDDKWELIPYSYQTTTDFAHIIGNGAINAKSNAYALDWQGNGHFSGDVYINCNDDSTGGTSISALIARIALLENRIAALEGPQVPTNAVYGQDGTPMTDEQGNYIEYNLPTT